MLIEIKKQLVPNQSKYSYGKGNPCKYITIHETDNKSKGAGARNHAIYQASGNVGYGWHYQVDDKEVIQSYEDTYKVYHAGDGTGIGNTESLSFEICVNPESDFKKAVDNAAKAVAMKMKEHGIPLSNIKQHYDHIGKNCPYNLRNNTKGISWQDFLNLVKKYRNQLDGKPKPTPKPTPTNLYRVQTTPVLTPKQADNTIQKLTRHKIEAVKVKTTDGLRVQAGAFADKKKATAQVDRVNGLGFGFAINPEESTEVLYKVQTNVLTKHLANKVTATLRANGLAFITLGVNNGHVVQVGAYGKLTNAHKRVDTLRGLGVQTVIVTDTGEKITPKNRTTQVKEIATKIWTDSNHPYGNGAERRKTLGDLYTDVQKYIEKHFIK